MTRRILHTVYASLAANILLAFAAYMICRVAYVADNLTLLWPDLRGADWPLLLKGSLLFDTAALGYTLALYILLMLVPVPAKECPAYYRLVKWAYIVPVGAGVVINLADSALYPFRLGRMQASIFKEFGGEDNVLGICLIELLNHWYLLLLAALMIWALWRLYRQPGDYLLRPRWRYYTLGAAALLVAGYFDVCAMRGSLLTTASRPIAPSEAHLYCSNASQPAVVLNTPFSLLRTMRERRLDIPDYYTDSEAMLRAFNPLHLPDTCAVRRDKNVVVIIVESFASEFVGGINGNRRLDNGRYRGYTPFVDELLDSALTWEQTFCNTGFSIDAMPAVLCSLPRMERPFVLTPYGMDQINSLASLLATRGYQSAFFHGANNKSLGLSAFARHAGFDAYYGIDEYVADPRFCGRRDFDGHWAIWDEPFLQYFALKAGELKEPFVASVFTASSHHPFKIPPQYADTFPDQGLHQLHKCIRYTDHALRRFFSTASRQPWYGNTIFVITADHASSKTTHPAYQTDLGHFRVPIIIFDPSGEMPRGVMPGVAQQADIMPTILQWLGYDRPYVAWGNPLLTTPPGERWAFNWVNVPQLVAGNYVMQWDGHAASALYNYVDDPLMQTDLRASQPRQLQHMDSLIKAVLQTYRLRADDDALTTASPRETSR